MTQTIEYWETQIYTDSFIFPSPKEWKHTRAHLFSIFPPPFLYLYKELRPLAIILVPPPFSVAGTEADGSWHHGGIVLTVELMWPQGCHICMLRWLWRNTMQSASLWKEVKGNPKEQKIMKREQLCVEVDRDRKNTFSQEPEETFACVSIKSYVGHGTIYNSLKSSFLSLWEGTHVKSLSVYWQICVIKDLNLFLGCSPSLLLISSFGLIMNFILAKFEEKLRWKTDKILLLLLC